ncbi:MAG: phosphotransferase [Deltaproteobacteria bacterium]|nr:phosphotransferase [Deltaproteobacteria bacterium]
MDELKQTTHLAKLRPEGTAFLRMFLSGQGLPQNQWQVMPLAGDGSGRSYFRVTCPGGSLILLDHPSPPGTKITENDSFDYLARHLAQVGVAVPVIYGRDLKQGLFVLEDLGDRHLIHAVQETRDMNQIISLYRSVIDVLIVMQTRAGHSLDRTRCFDTPTYDPELVIERELGYFLREFAVGYLGLELSGEVITRALRPVIGQTIKQSPMVFLHRDFQSRNILLQKTSNHVGAEDRVRVRVIDFQGGRLGPPYYDLAALLNDPYTDLDSAVKDALVEYYLDQVAGVMPEVKAHFAALYPLVALFRNLQVLGAFAYLGHKLGKPGFKEHIPAAFRNLVQLLESIHLPELGPLSELVAQAALVLAGRG